MMWSYFYLCYFFLYLLFPLRRCDYHFLLQWGLGHAKTWLSTFSLRTYFETHLVLLRFTCCLFLEIKFWTFWHFPLEVRFFLNNWGLKKSYNITVFNPSTRLSLHANTPLTSAELGWSSFFFNHWELGSIGCGVRCVVLVCALRMSWLWWNMDC